MRTIATASMGALALCAAILLAPPTACAQTAVVEVAEGVSTTGALLAPATRTPASKATVAASATGFGVFHGLPSLEGVARAAFLLTVFGTVGAGWLASSRW